MYNYTDMRALISLGELSSLAITLQIKTRILSECNLKMPSLSCLVWVYINCVLIGTQTFGLCVEVCMHRGRAVVAPLRWFLSLLPAASDGREGLEV